jgi:hypothetical protein
MKITDHNFKLWWDKLSDDARTANILSLLLEKQTPKENPYYIPSEEEVLELYNKPIDKSLIEKIKSIKTYTYRSINDYNQTFNFLNIKYLRSLKYLSLTDTKHFRGVKNIKWLENLETINLINCKNLTDFANTPEINNPLYINISECRNQNVNTFNNFTNLIFINLSDSSRLNFPSNTNLSNLRQLEFERCNNSNIEIDFKQLPNLISLKLLKTTGKIKIKNPQYANHLYHLEINKAAITNPEELQYIPCLNPKDKDKIFKRSHCSILTISYKQKIKTTQTKKGPITSLI